MHTIAVVIIIVKKKYKRRSRRVKHEKFKAGAD
jgi:hypothetical protein